MIWRWMVLASVLLVPVSERSIYREAWLADLRDCAELDLRPAGVARGAARLALSPRNLRRRVSPTPGEVVMGKQAPNYAVIAIACAAWTGMWLWVLIPFVNELLSYGGGGAGGGVRIFDESYMPLAPIAVSVATAAALPGVVGMIVALRRSGRQAALLDAMRRRAGEPDAPHPAGD